MCVRRRPPHCVCRPAAGRRAAVCAARCPPADVPAREPAVEGAAGAIVNGEHECVYMYAGCDDIVSVITLLVDNCGYVYLKRVVCQYMSHVSRATCLSCSRWRSSETSAHSWAASTPPSATLYRRAEARTLDALPACGTCALQHPQSAHCCRGRQIRSRGACARMVVSAA